MAAKFQNQTGNSSFQDKLYQNKCKNIQSNIIFQVKDES